MVVAGVGALVTRWARVYADHKAVSGGITYLHLAGIVLGGGLAVSADRAALRWTAADGTDGARGLHSLCAVHRRVVGGLALTFVSGVAMLLADLATYLTSAVFWTRMAL